MIACNIYVSCLYTIYNIYELFFGILAIFVLTWVQLCGTSSEYPSTLVAITCNQIWRKISHLWLYSLNLNYFKATLSIECKKIFGKVFHHSLIFFYDFLSK